MVTNYPLLNIFAFTDSVSGSGSADATTGNLYFGNTTYIAM